MILIARAFILLLCVTAIRVAYDLETKQYSLQMLLNALSGIDFDFSSVLWNISELGSTASGITSGGLGEGILSVLKTIGLAVVLPVSLIADLVTFLYSVSLFVFSLLGFMPA